MAHVASGIAFRRARARRLRGAALLLAGSAASLGAAAAARAAAIAVTDDLGKSVHMQAPARRAITLAPHATELVYAAGAGAYLAASVKGSNYPPPARRLASIGDGVRPSIEAIAAIDPDLVIAWLPGAAQGLEPLLSRAGVAIFYSNPRRLADLPADIEKLGRLFGTSVQAHATASSMRDRLAALAARYRDREPVRVFIQVSRTPLISLNRESIVSDAVQLCGGVNLFANAPATAPQISREAALAARPQAILTGLSDPVEIALDTAAWRAMAADPARAPVVLAFDPDVLYRPGPRLLDLTQTLCEKLDRLRGKPATP